MAPIEKGLGKIDSVFHKYPRYLNWNKNRISEVGYRYSQSTVYITPYISAYTE